MPIFSIDQWLYNINIVELVQMKTNIISNNQHRPWKIEKITHYGDDFNTVIDYRILLGRNVESVQIIKIEMLLVNLKVKIPHTKTYYTML